VSISSVGLSVLCATRARVNNADGKKKKKGIELGDAKTYQKCRSPECGSLAAKRVIPVSAAYKDLKRDFERCLSTIPGPGAHVAQTVYALCHTCAGEQRGWKKKKKEGSGWAMRTYQKCRSPEVRQPGSNASDTGVSRVQGPQARL
jgi:hypothetical protein